MYLSSALSVQSFLVPMMRENCFSDDVCVCMGVYCCKHVSMCVRLYVSKQYFSGRKILKVHVIGMWMPHIERESLIVLVDVKDDGVHFMSI